MLKMSRPRKTGIQMPIRLRLTLTFTTLVMVMLLGLGLGLYLIVAQTLNSRLQTDLQSSADNLLVESGHRADSAIILPGPLVTNTDQTTNNPPPEIITQLQVDPAKLTNTTLIYRADEALLAAPTDGIKSTPELAAAARSAKALPDGQFVLSKTRLPNLITNNGTSVFLIYARPIYGLSDPNDAQSRPALVGVYVDSRDYTETDTLLTTMSQVLLIGSGLALLVSLLVGSLVAGRALRPIKDITSTARQIGATDLSRRIGLDSKDELGQLAHTFDAMIARLEAGFGRQRRFIADASHELRTPLSVIEAEATLMLKREREADDYRQALRLIADETGRMRSLIEDMLTLAKADSGELELLPQQVALDDLVTEAVERINRLARERNQRIQLDVANEVWLRGDPVVLTSLFFNLLSNAVKYSPPEGLIIVRVLQPDPTQAVVQIKDEGPGIAPEHIPHLFDRFYRIDQTRRRQLDPADKSSGSSGLGLSIAKWAAEAHGGQINVYSAVGQGTTFEVVLPVKGSQE